MILKESVIKTQTRLNYGKTVHRVMEIARPASTLTIKKNLAEGVSAVSVVEVPTKM